MFSFPQIFRWLSFDADPLTVEDWLANREVFGPVEKPNSADLELERAFGMETEMTTDSGTKGVYERENLLLIIGKGKGKGEPAFFEWCVGKEKNKKTRIFDSFILNVSPDQEIKLKVSGRNGFKVAGKNEFSWQGKGKTKIVIDMIKM